MKIYWIPCGCNSSYSFPLIVLKLFRCFLQGMMMCIWFGYNSLIIFPHCFLNLVFFQYEMLSKCIDSEVYRQWVPCGCNSSYSFALIVLKLGRCFLHRMKMYIWFWYTALIFFHFVFPVFSYLLAHLSRKLICELIG